jgi:hypothetical protein
MSDTKEISCSMCNTLFSSTRKNHITCSNLCCVRRYQIKQNLRSLLSKVKEPAQLAALELFMETLMDGSPSP